MRFLNFLLYAVSFPWLFAFLRAEQAVVVNGLEFRTNFYVITRNVFTIKVAIKNLESKPVKVVLNVADRNVKQVDGDLLWLGFVLVENDLFPEDKYYKPSEVELGIVELGEGESALLTTNRWVFDPDNVENLNSIRVVYHVDDELKRFYDNVWTGNVKFSFEPREGSRVVSELEQ